MSSSQKQYMYSVLRQAWKELRVFGGKAMGVLMKTPLPKLLLVCVAIALLLTIVPLILTLFVVFVLIKILLLLLFSSVRRDETPYRESHRTQAPFSQKDMDVEDAKLVRVEQIEFRSQDKK
ncbi:hypothetical protein RF679_12710 [Undibacterium cyanobacteriorum]|uniref:DUF3742 domain-containing protein n=1 Tax=Undibacterium cyanobacteriorum TaxID=3073561 RepID=A0ABY9RE54_9BURK|nr:hypothetical protein [Undibacterium sp. 20NA77.5]WMW79506.1 hypothetical protein RF679_12710 [Undibacterium sp. 20NA77.5]